MIRKYIFVLIFIIQGLCLFATPQARDRIIYNGIEYKITENPMEEYFEKYPRRRPFSGSTGLYRGYIATFEIINNELWVIKIETDGVGKNAWNLVDVTRRSLGRNNRMKVDWFSGSLFIPQGDLLSFDRYLLYEYIYEYFIIIEIRDGNYHDQYIMDSEEYLSRLLKREGLVEYIPVLQPPPNENRISYFINQVENFWFFIILSISLVLIAMFIIIFIKFKRRKKC